MLLSLSGTLPYVIDRKANIAEKSVRWLPILDSHRVLRAVDDYHLWYETE